MATPAGTYASLRGSKNALGAAHRAGGKLAQDIPNVNEVVKENAAALVRVVGRLASEGHRLFADLGGGQPVQGMDARKLPELYEVARQRQEDLRWLLLDSDIVAVTHARASIGRLPGVAVVQEDLRHPTKVLEAIDTHLGLDRPIVVILGAVLHFLTEQEVAELMYPLRELLVPGSVVVATHVTSTGVARRRSPKARPRTRPSTASPSIRVPGTRSRLCPARSPFASRAWSARSTSCQPRMGYPRRKGAALSHVDGETAFSR
jgi:hypothetical protein